MLVKEIPYMNPLMLAYDDTINNLEETVLIIIPLYNSLFYRYKNKLKDFMIFKMKVTSFSKRMNYYGTSWKRKASILPYFLCLIFRTLMNIYTNGVD